MLSPENQAIVEKLTAGLEAEYGALKELEELAAQVFEKEYARLRKLERLQQRIAEEQSRVRERIHEKDTSGVLRDIAEANLSISQIGAKIKRVFHGLTAEEGSKFLVGNVQISVSKGRYETSYDSLKLLQDHPELEDVLVDGDPLVEPKINPIILERLVSMKKVTIPNLKDYKTTVCIRTPSVSIKVGGTPEQSEEQE